MNLAFQSYTPRVIPLNYDSLLSQEGCESDSGNTWFDVLPFTTVCVSYHDESNQLFAIPDTTSYFYGPTAPGVETKPFLTGWKAVAGKDGVLVGKQGTAGALSGLYPSGVYSKVTGAFSQYGWLLLAVQKNSEAIEIRRYTDGAGNTQTISFTGYSAVAFNIGLLLHRDSEQPGVVVFYLRQDQPRKLFARFETENFANERVVNNDMRVPLVRLIAVYAFGTRLYLIGTDSNGRDVTLKSENYGAIILDSASESIAFLAGAVFAAAVPIDLPEESQILSLQFLNGLVFSAIVTPSPQPPEEAATLAIGFLEGAVI